MIAVDPDRSSPSSISCTNAVRSESEVELRTPALSPNQKSEAMTQLTAAFLNCTLKPSPAVSNTETLANKVIEWFDQLEVTSEMIRVVDYNVKPGATSDEGDGDEWPLILDKIKRSDIIIIATPIWFGLRSSVAQRVIERLDGT